MTFCENCGSKLAPESQFCDQCGTEVSKPRSSIEGKPPSIVSVTDIGTADIGTKGIASSEWKSTSDPKLKGFKLKGAWLLLLGGLLHCIVSFIQQSAILGEPTLRLSFALLSFGVWPIGLSIFLLVSKPRFHRVTIFFAYCNIFLILAWWYPSWGTINFWDVESTMRYYGEKLVVTILIFSGIVQASLSYLLRSR